MEAAKRNRVVAIVNRDPPSGESYLPTASLELVSADPTPESAGSVDFAVVLNRVWGEDARFEVELDAHDNLTATPAFSRLGQTGDFEAPDGLIHATIPAGQTRFEFSLTLYDDDVREEDETFQMLLGSSITSSQRRIGDEDKALVTIADDDFVEPTGVELALTSNNGVFDSVAEDSSQHDITVTASFSDIRWPTDAADAALRPADPRDVDTTVRVEFDSANSAAAQTDIERFQVADSQDTFQDVESFDIVIPAGQTSGTTTLRFKPANDDVDEEAETVILQGAEVVASDSDEFLTINSASFTITDDDTRGITVSPASLATGSGIGMMEGGTSTYSLVLDSEPTDTVTVTVSSEQDNLIRLTPETLTFTPSNWSTTQTISVVSLDDGADTSFTNASIAHRVSGGDYGSVSVGDISVIIENTTQAYIYLDDAQASESDGYVEFTVSVRPILRTVPVVVRYTTVDGTATAGTDYTRQVNTGQTYKIFSIPANGGAATIRIPITDNEVYGPAKKTFTLQLTNQNNKALLDGDATSLTATGSIIDDDPKPVVSVAGPAGDLSYVSEDMKGPVTFTLTLTGRSAADVTVDYTTGQAQVLSGLAARQDITSATAGEDYTAATGTVTFSSGDATKQVTVQLTDDDVSEDTEFFGFKISNAQNAQLRNKATEEVADVGLLDDDPRGVAIDPTSISLEEPAPGEAAVASSYTVKLNSKPTDTVTVTIGGANPAVSLSGATLSNTNTLTFTTSNWDTAQTVTVTPVEDTNGVGETITLTHIQSGGDYTGIAADSVTVNVTDSDTRNVVLSPTSLTVTEGDDTGVSYAVKLSTQPSNTVTVTIGGHSGTDLSISGATLSNSNTLTFSTSNWNTAQMVTAKAGHDGNADDESETLTHTASGGDYANLTKDLPVTVTDDAPATVTVSFGAASYTVTEGSSRTVTVTLDADPERTVVIPIEKTNQGATSADYSGVPQNVTFDSGDTSKSFTFTAAHDTVDDDDESVKLSFGATLPTGVSAGTPATSTVTITDDDVPSVTVSFGSAAYTVAESDDSDTTDVTENTVEVTVTLSADPERTVVIPLTATGQGATSADYSGVPQNVTFDSGDTSKSFTFTAATDTVDDDGESVKLSFGATLPTGVSAGTPATSTVTITDDDVPSVTVSFGSAAYTVAESDDSDTPDVTENTVEVTVTLSADPERTVVIPISKTNEGGATSDDYSGVPPSVTFGSGDTEKTFVFTAETDTVDDDGESVKLSFGATLPDGVTAGTPATSTVTITDDDVPSVTVSFGSAAYTVAESDDSDTPDVTENTVEVTVTLSADPERRVVIPIEKTNQDGATTPDYSGVPQNVTFDSGDTSKTFTFTAAHDTDDDDGESVKLTFGATLPDGVTAGTPATSAVTITDDDDPQVTVAFGQSTYSATEGSTVTVEVTLSADPERAVVIPIEAANEGGASDSDYTGVPQSVTFDAGDTSKSFDLSAVEDNLAESGERVKLSFGALPADASSGTPDEAAVSINDRTQGQDLPTSPFVHFESAAYSVDEGATVAVKVKLSKAPGSETVIPITETNRAGASDDDYSGVPDSLTFGAADTEKTITFAATDDSVDDDGEKVELSFGSLPGGITATTGEAAEAVVTITDDDKPTVLTVEFGQAAYTAAEGGAVTVKVTLSDDPEMDLTIPISKTNEGGATSADYSGVPPSVTFGSGDTEKTFVFTAETDTDDDDGESVKLSFGTLPTTPVTVTAGTTDEATVTITDDDVPSVTVSFGAASYTVTEGASRTVTVTLDADPERTVVIPIAKTDQDGATTADYSGVPQNVTFDSGDTSKSFTFTAAHDTVDDDGESVKLSFGATLPTGVTAGTPATSTVTITDDDVPSVTVSFGAASYTVTEGASRTVTVTLDADPERTVVIPIEAANEGGASDSDYTGVPQSVTFDSGDTEKTFVFTAETDAVDDDGESVKLSFGATLPTGVTAGTPATSTVTITDDDVPSVTVSFGAASYTVTEGASRTVTVTLDADPERTVVIPIAKTDQDGATTADYSGVPQNVTFDSGESSKSFTFSATKDSINDDNESVLLAFGTLPAGVSPGTPDQATVSITDDTAVSYSSDNYSATEGGADAIVSVNLSRPAASQISIFITATGHNGATSEDWMGVPFSLTFNTGDSSNSFTVVAVDDEVEDNGEMVELGFRDLPAGFVPGSPPTARITLMNDDSTPNGALRLVDGVLTDENGRLCEGRLEIFYNGAWGTICDDYWAKDDADVACRALGFVASVEDYDRYRTAYFGPGTEDQEIVLDDLLCNGDESGLLECPSGHPRPGIHNCRHSEDVGLRCLKVGQSPPWIIDVEFSGPPGGNGVYDAGETVEATLVWSEPVTISTPSGGLLPKVWVVYGSGASGHTDIAEYASGSGTDRTVFRHTLQSGSYSLVGVAYNSLGVRDGSIVSVESGLDAELGHSSYYSAQSENQAEAVTIIGVPTFNDPGPDNAWRAGEAVEVTFTFSRPVQVDTTGGAPSLPVLLSGAASRQALYLRGSGTRQLVFGYTLTGADGTHSSLLIAPDSLALNGGSIKDVDNMLDAAIEHQGAGAFYVQQVVDETAPEVQSAAVDGATLTLAYNEDLDTGVTPPASAFAVNVNGASWSIDSASVSGSAVTLTLASAVESGDTVTADYTVPTGESANKLQDASGNAAESFSGQAVTNNTASSGTARSAPAPPPGSPTSLKVSRHESGKLLASWSAPNSGPTPTGYTLQWKESGDDWNDADDVSEASVKGTSHVITGLTDGVRYAMRVIAYKGDAESDPSGEVTATPQETVPPSPSAASVDGATLTITFDEPLDTGEAPDKSSFAVAVAGSSRGVDTVTVAGSVVTITLVTAALSGEAVTVDYTVPTGATADRLRDLAGNTAASFSGREVTNNTAPAQSEESSESQDDTPNSPGNLKVARHESGQLRASWDAPDSGPTPTGYTLQWKESGDAWDDADDVSEANVNGTSHVITGLTGGVQYAVRVIAYKGDAESDPSGEITATPQETVPPSPSAASVDGATLTITFDEPLDTGETPDKSAFAVAVAGSSRGVDTGSVSGSIVTLTLVTAVFAGEVVTVDYTVPTDDSAARLQDLAGNAAASFSGPDATNATQAADQLTASVSVVPESHDGSTVFTFELRFSETPRKRFSYKIMRDRAFTVTGGEVTGARRLVPTSNVGWEIHVRPDGNGPVTIVLPVTTDCTAEGAICTEDRRPLSNRLEITVPAPGG